MDSKNLNPLPSTVLPGPSHSGAAIDSIAGPMDAPQAGSSKKTRQGDRKKRRGRKQSFVGASRSGFDDVPEDDAAGSPQASPEATRFWKRGPARRSSESSSETEALLDHRYVRTPPPELSTDTKTQDRAHSSMRTRRDSRPVLQDLSSSFQASSFRKNQARYNGKKRGQRSSSEDTGDDAKLDSRTPLLQQRRDSTQGIYGLFGAKKKTHKRSGSTGTSQSSTFRRPLLPQQNSSLTPFPEYDINNPPSVPPSPQILANANNLDDLTINEFSTVNNLDQRAVSGGDQLIDIDGDANANAQYKASSSTPRPADQRRHTLPFTTAEDDVCYPVEGMSESGDEDYMSPTQTYESKERPRRKRARQWPDISVLEEWSRDEKEERSENRRTKAVNEPVMIDGRLRPHNNHWHRDEDDAPYRFTYFNEELESTLHSQTLSELQQPDQTFKDLFIPEPPTLEESSSEEDEEEDEHPRSILSTVGPSRTGTRQSSILGDTTHTQPTSPPSNNLSQSQAATVKPKRYGPRPTFWLDVLNPTESEMKVIQRTFGIHPLTAEDILVQEAREKVELFRNYYFVNYRTFEQDPNSIDYLEPINYYTVVFRDGVITFHFSMSPHPANVRRRIRQLKDYLVLTADWICYALIDDITDVFGPLIQNIEDEVDDIDDSILMMHVGNAKDDSAKEKSRDIEKRSEAGETTTATTKHGNLLLRVGRGRKKVMGLYRLLGNKADVIKGFAKRCNEQWDVAPRSEIGLYLGDIQDHILTMTSNLTHYET